jgi:hypothetical protein
MVFKKLSMESAIKPIKIGLKCHEILSKKQKIGWIFIRDKMGWINDHHQFQP